MKTYSQVSLQTYTAFHQMPDVLNAFGMVMPERSFSNEKYRYGFNGKETDRETQWQDYGFRIYYPGLCKFVSVDPLTKSFPWNSPYAFAENDVIRSIDLEGLEKYVVTGRTFIPDAKLPNPAPWGSSQVKGDNRQCYDVNSTAYRTEQKVTADFDNNQVYYTSNRASGSTGLDANGNVIDNSEPTVAGFIKNTPITEKSTAITIYLKVEAHDKLIFGAPDIDYDLAITITPSVDGKSFDYQVKGQTDGFPAYELWITDETNNKSFLLLNSNPKEAGETPWSLWGTGEHNYDLKGNSNSETPKTKVNFSDTQNSPESD